MIGESQKMVSHFELAEALGLSDSQKLRKRCIEIIGRERLAIEKRQRGSSQVKRKVEHVFLNINQCSLMINRSYLSNRDSAFKKLEIPSCSKKFQSCEGSSLIEGYYVRGKTVSVCREDTSDTYSIIGNVFGRLTVEKVLGRTKHGHLFYGCVCECGESVAVYGATLVGGRTKSCGCYKRKEKWHSHISSVVLSYRRSAETRGYSFDLSRKDFENIIFQPCHYCGAPPSNKKDVSVSRCQPGVLSYNGIDRKDNTIGYSVDNCVPCCIVCNRAKSAMTYRGFIGWIDGLCKFRPKK